MKTSKYRYGKLVGRKRNVREISKRNEKFENQ